MTTTEKKFSKEIIEEVMNNNDCSESKLSKKLMLGKSDIKLIRQHIATGSVSSLIEEEKPKEVKQRKKGRKLSNAEKILIIDRRNKGEAYRKIASDFDISDFTVRKICMDNSNDFINLIDDPDTLCREFIFKGITDKEELSRLSRTTDNVIDNLLHRFENLAFTFDNVQDSDTNDDHIEEELLDEPVEYDPVSEIDIKDNCTPDHDNISTDPAEEVSSYPNITTYNINGVDIPYITIDYYISGNTLDVSHDFVVNIINLYISDASLNIKDHIVHVQDVLYIDSYMIMWLNSKLNVFTFEPAFSLINEMYAISETDKKSYYENRNAILENDMKEVRKAYKILHKILTNDKEDEDNNEEYVDYCEEVLDSSHYINNRSLPALTDEEYFWRKDAERRVNLLAKQKGSTFGSINKIIFNQMNTIYGIVWDQCRKDFKRDYNIDDHVTVSKWRLVCHNKILRDLYDTVFTIVSNLK